MLDLLRAAVATGGNLVNLGRSLAVRNPALHAWVLAATGFLAPDAKFTERVYCLVNGLTAIPICALSGRKRPFINFFEGYQRAVPAPRIAVPNGGLTAADLTRLRAQSDIGRFVGRMAHTDPELYLRVLGHTPDFGDASTMERVYCILHGIPQRPRKMFRNFRLGYPEGEGDPEVRERLLRCAALVGADTIAQGKKVRVFLKRNRARNSALYALPAEAEGREFVVCPVLGVRMLNLKRPYVEGVLGMSWQAFRERFPDAQLACAAHSARIAAGLATEIAPGVTGHALGVVKATASRAQVGADGLTGNARKGAKVRATHMHKGPDGMTGYERLAHYRNTTILPNGLSIQQNSLRKRFEAMVNGERSNTRASKMSRRMLSPLLEYLTDASLKHYFGDTEYGVRTQEGHFFYDLVIPAANLCVEYQSAAYHPNPIWAADKWAAWAPPFKSCRIIKADDKYEFDLLKARIMWRERGFQTWFVWQDSADEDVECIILYLRNEFPNVETERQV